ncbi:uncharacterized protein LOC143526583 isoform X2 [Brachyhypopomus gauderio]|uniref:uncharacterized protein LOC143526583 isoform X2 n=1 Tax=Brachyhypopomus gauderio TaxID=698409 RepID=UPI004041603E
MQQGLGIRRVVSLVCLTALMSSGTDPVRTNIVNQLDSVITAVFGGNVTLHCFGLEEDSTDPVVWYKQKVGHEPRIVAMAQKLVQTPTYYSEFNHPKFSIVKGRAFCHLTITSVEPSDEAVYFCGIRKFETVFGKGTFLSVKGHVHLTTSVVQSPDVGRVPPGESVSLQCSVLSERRTAELQVFWFRSSAGDSHPEIISTHHNSSRQCEISSSPHSCVYNLSKSVLSVSDTGTYYCAVLTCGKILLGNGTTVYISSPVDAVLMMVGAALGVCVLVISAQAVLICRRRNCEHCSVRLQQGTMETKITSQDHDPVELNYTAFHFSKRKPRRGQEKRGQEKRGQLDYSVYSEVLYSTATD